MYNKALEKKINEYIQNKKSISCFDLINYIKTEFKDKEEFNWLNDVASQSLQQSIHHLGNAFTKFFKKGGFPKFKNKKSKQSFSLPQGVKIKNNKLYLPKLGLVKCKFDRLFKGKIKTSTISKDKCNNYFVSILIEINQELPKTKKITEKTSIGLDLGIKTFCTLSNDIKIDNPKFYLKLDKQLKKQQRIFAKKKNGSKNKEKQRLKVAKIYNKISNQKQDFLHKLSYNLIHDKQVNTIIIEDLNVQGMSKNIKLARSIINVSWAEFVRQLEYKSLWYGKNLIKIGRFEPSSKLCSNCGFIKKDLKLADREWTCQICKITHDRDLNAAKNIKSFGLNKQNLIGQVLPEFKPLETSSVDDR